MNRTEESFDISSIPMYRAMEIAEYWNNPSNGVHMSVENDRLRLVINHGLTSSNGSYEVSNIITSINKYKI